MKVVKWEICRVEGTLSKESYDKVFATLCHGMSRADSQTFCPGRYSGGQNAVAVCEKLVTLPGPEKGLMYLAPCGLAALKMSLYGGDSEAEFTFWEKGGLVTEGAFKGDNPVAEEVRELCAYSIHGSLVTQEVGFWETVQWSADSSFWFSLSVSPLVCRWKTELRLTLAPRAGQKVLHTCEVNWGPWSEGLEGNSMESEYVVDQILGCFRSGR